MKTHLIVLCLAASVVAGQTSAPAPASRAPNLSLSVPQAASNLSLGVPQAAPNLSLTPPPAASSVPPSPGIGPLPGTAASSTLNTGMAAGPGMAANATNGATARIPSPPSLAPSEVMPPSPGPQFRWVPGFYAWTGTTWTWIAGAWRVPPDPNATWVPPAFDAATGSWTMGSWVAGGNSLGP